MLLHKQEFSLDFLARILVDVFQQMRIRRHLVALLNRIPTGDPLEFAGPIPVFGCFGELMRFEANEMFSTGVLELFESHMRPGNLIELRNGVDFSAAQASEEVLEQHLPMYLNRQEDGGIKAGCDYQWYRARGQVSLIEHTIREQPTQNKTQLISLLGYKNCFTIQTKDAQGNEGVWGSLLPSFPILQRSLA
ncbi:MAG: hypothetical protein PHO08_05990 [Methylococcales bacterium]|nr:hypothetical protein [Methylococcales bacterium]